ncbi:MAG: hypothetical protein J7K21_04665 [Desulfurococcales archaeon]|nr:hypothetical protein [Desulfurococcales archaeon]
MIKYTRYYKTNLGVITLLDRVLDKYRKALYDYNKLISGKGYYLKPVHIVVKKSRTGIPVKYIYYGRYWYRIKYIGKRSGTSRIKWTYIGRYKPDPNLPDPPVNPLEGIVVKIDRGRYYINIEPKIIDQIILKKL